MGWGGWNWPGWKGSSDYGRPKGGETLESYGGRPIGGATLLIYGGGPCIIIGA